MSERSTKEPSESTSFAEASHARTSASPVKEPASTENGAGYGPSSLASFAYFDPASWSLKTCQHSLGEGSTEFSETLPPAGTMRSGRLFERATWVLRTSESESSSWPTAMGYAWERPGLTKLDIRVRGLYPGNAHYWPTPDANVFNDAQTLEAWESRHERERMKGYNGNGGGTPLAMAVRMDPQRLWPTATAKGADASGGQQMEWTPSRHTGTTLTDATARGLWATPIVRDARGPSRGVNAQGSMPLAQQVMWPTPASADGDRSTGNYARGNPTLAGAAKWPTPQARDEKGPTGMGDRLESGGRRSSLSDSAMPDATGGRLNASWVEVLMGFPIGYTDVGPQLPARRSTTGSPRASSRRKSRTVPRGSEPSGTQ